MKIDFYLLNKEMVDRKQQTGWKLEYIDYKREWMEETPHRFAYRCLPLTIANQLGWVLKNPVGFWAKWNGKPEPDDVRKNIEFRFDSERDFWLTQINCQFGSGIVTFNTPYLIVTSDLTHLIVTGPFNHFIKDAYPLTGYIETNWMVSSFTMNYKLLEPHKSVRFNQHEPLAQLIPVTNCIEDIQNCSWSIQPLEQNKTLSDRYNNWKNERDKFHEMKRQGLVVGNSWQRDYFGGKGTEGKHYLKIIPPKIK